MLKTFINIFRVPELRNKVLFTLMMLAIYRIGYHVPIPGVNQDALAKLSQMQAQGGSAAGRLASYVSLFSGGSLSQSTMFGLGVMPYISASIIIQMMAVVVPQLAAIKKEGESGRKRLNQYTRYGTVALTAVQGYFMAAGLENFGAQQGLQAVIEPGLMFRLTAVISLIGGTLFLMWIGEQITSRGIGNGISLIIMAGIVARLPTTLIQLFESGRSGTIDPLRLILIIVGVAALVLFICFMERAQRRILIQYPKRQTARGVQAERSHLPLKLNTAGVIPPIFASSLLLLPLTITQFAGQKGYSEGWWGDTLNLLNTYLHHGSVVYMVLYGAGIIFFSFFYTAVVFNPEETAENLKRYGGFIPGIRPGKNTEVYFDYVLTRITVIGAAYLTLICLVPEYVTSVMSIPFLMGGTSLLIVVNVTMDTVTQIQSHLLAHQYGDLIKKAKLKGRMR